MGRLAEKGRSLFTHSLRQILASSATTASTPVTAVTHTDLCVIYPFLELPWMIVDMVVRIPGIVTLLYVFLETYNVRCVCVSNFNLLMVFT